MLVVKSQGHSDLKMEFGTMSIKYSWQVVEANSLVVILTINDLIVLVKQQGLEV